MGLDLFGIMSFDLLAAFRCYRAPCSKTTGTHHPNMIEQSTRGSEKTALAAIGASRTSATSLVQGLGLDDTMMGDCLDPRDMTPQGTHGHEINGPTELIPRSEEAPGAAHAAI